MVRSLLSFNVQLGTRCLLKKNLIHLLAIESCWFIGSEYDFYFIA